MMKNEIKTTITVLAVIILFLGGLALGTTQGINVNIGAEFDVNGAEVQTTVTQVVATTETTTTQVTTTTAATDDSATQDTTTDETTTDEEETTVAQEDESTALPATTAEIAARYNELINAVKVADYVEIVKEQDLVVNVTDCSISMATSLVDSAVSAVMAADSWSSTFTDGVGDSGLILSENIYPASKDSALTADGLAVATCEATADGGYTIYIEFAEETSVYDGSTTTPAQTYHSTALDPIDLATFEIPAVTISSADMYYEGATVTLTVNADGLLIRQDVYLPMAGTGVGTISFFSPSITIEGYADTVYTFSY